MASDMVLYPKGPGMVVDDSSVDASDSVEIQDDYSSVTVYKINTPKGERLGIESAALGATIQLDALDLESVSWQDDGTLVELVEQTRPELSAADVIPARENLPSDTGTAIRIGNEFTQVTATIGGGGACVELRSEKLDYETRLSAVVLEALTTHGPELFDEFLDTPFGPDQQH